MRKVLRIATMILLATALSWPVAASPGDPPASLGELEPPIPIFLNAPTDLEAFWMMLSRPDFVVIDGDLFRKLRLANQTPNQSKMVPSAIVESLAVTGEISGDWASLIVEFRVAMTAEGPSWVPIQLDGLPLTDIRDGTGDLPTKISESRSWQVELKGKGEHIVRVGLLAPVRSTVDEKRLELLVPPASSTRIDLMVPRNVVEASTGLNEKVGLVLKAEGPGVRLSTRLSPRSRIDLTWKERVDPAGRLPTLLSAQGEISLEIERGSIGSRSSWIIGSIRGTTSQLTLRLDPAEELLDVEVDNKPVQVEARREGKHSVVSIPLSDPLRPNTTRALLLNTKRPISSSGTTRVAIQGYSFDQAKVQTGVIAIARTGPIYLNPTPGRGLRRIDPRTELPESLRARPDTTLAFEFNDQPFDLNLGVEPAPPRLQIGTRTTVTIDPQSARLQASLDCRTSQGRVFEIKVDLPKGLEFEGAEPADVVESAQVVPLDPETTLTPGVDVPRVVTLTLTPRARESDAFTILLKGWSTIDPSKQVALPIFQPRASSIERAQLAIVTDRNVLVELAGDDKESPAFQIDWGMPPTDWVWPVRKPGPESGLLWLRSDLNSESIPLKVTVRPRSIRHESTLNATIDRKGVEVVEEFFVEVAFGVASRLDVSLPPDIPARWDVEGVELAGREPQGADSGGGRRYRLRFAHDYADVFRFRVRYRLPLIGANEADRETKLRLEPIRILEGNSTGQRVSISAEPTFALKSEARGWDASEIPEPSAASEGRPPIRLAFSKVEERPGPVNLLVKEGPSLVMPEVVVSRLWLRSVQGLENDLVTTARLWVDTRDGSMRVGLPSGSRWVKARVGGAEVAESDVELLAPDEYRLKFPTTALSGATLVRIDFIVPAASTMDGWPTIRLFGGGIVQQTIWEVQILGARAGIGTPAGWTDENEWFWTGWLWKRRPAKSLIEVANWLSGGNTRFLSNELLDSGELGGYQAYLFSREGPPSTLRFPILGRISLLLLCSGPVLAVGLMVLARRPPPRLIVAMALIVSFAAGTLIEPDVLILIIQSSVLGIALWLSALAMNWGIEKAGHARATGQGALPVSPSSTASSMVRPSPTKDDESTAIRPRPAQLSAASTADHVILIRTQDRLSDEFTPPDPNHR